MKRFLFVFSTLLILGSFCACSNSDEIDIKSTDGSSDIEEGTGNDMSVTYETSTDPKERIVGSWLLVKCNEDAAVLTIEELLHLMLRRNDAAHLEAVEAIEQLIESVNFILSLCLTRFDAQFIDAVDARFHLVR